MLQIPPSVFRQYSIYLGQRNVSPPMQRMCIKGLHYYPDFCQKYNFKHDQESDWETFMEKMVEKGQGLDLRWQAYRAVSIFHEINPLSQAKATMDYWRLANTHNMLAIYIFFKMRIRKGTANRIAELGAEFAGSGCFLKVGCVFLLGNMMNCGKMDWPYKGCGAILPANCPWYHP